ncbi:hypothetical protein PG993_008259 [Apiospora rasikravindrae]|uniref:Uncharacterized protein n=1 Tax=Apiospora rasikravindrae TaxID=990691 RepID=A0ABR1SZU3_9PEZI
MHKRLPRKLAAAIPYGKETLSDTCEHLFQHRSLCSTMPRKSHAVFNTCPVTWSDHKSLGPSIVYNCRSDTVCQTPEENDILMSVTTFPKFHLTFAVMYGCTDTIMGDVSQYLDTFRRPAFYPLMLPMMFVELERKRLLGAVRRETSNLDQRIMEMESRLSNRTPPKSMDEKAGVIVETMLQKDCKATKDWLQVSKLQDGVQSLITILDCMKTLSQEFLKESETGATYVDNRQLNTKKFQDRLGEIKIELMSEVRNCESILGGMTLATQMEWNYHTRRDAKANIIIACASKVDSNQMRLISILGMIFLPGTFLAKRARKWSPPWIGLYCGAAAMLTLLMWWLSTKYFAVGQQDTLKEIQNALDSDDGSMV